MTTEHSARAVELGLEPLLDIRDLADYLGLPVSTLYDWRTRGLGPREVAAAVSVRPGSAEGSRPATRNCASHGAGR